MSTTGCKWKERLLTDQILNKCAEIEIGCHGERFLDLLSCSY